MITIQNSDFCVPYSDVIWKPDHLTTGQLPNILIPDLSGIKMVTIDTFVFDAVGFALNQIIWHICRKEYSLIDDRKGCFNDSILDKKYSRLYWD